MIFLFALSTSIQAPESIEMALDFTKEQEATLRVLFVLDSSVPGTIFERLTDIGFIGEKPSQELEDAVKAEYKNQALQQLSEIEELAKTKSVNCEVMLEQGDFVECTLAAIAKYTVDTLIISRAKQSALSRLLVGSAVDKLVRRSPCEIKLFEA